MVKYVVQVVAFGCLSTYLLFSAIIVAIAAKDFGAFEWGFVAIFVGVPAFLDVKLYKALKRTQRERRCSRHNARRNQRVMHRNDLNIGADSECVGGLAKDISVMDEVDRLFAEAHADCANETLRSANEEERTFVAELVQHIRRARISRSLKLERLSDKTLNVWLKGMGYIGKINVGNGRNYMQLPRTLDRMDEQRNLSFEECLFHIPVWITYIRKYLMTD
ncbi:hypothetical protein [Filifactor villosus]|uniref:Uncharacterized protein n=1 Tax=Filifactor villosus TaxID=29374 RepID=A0ABV9QPX4_9FIRM